MEALTDRSTADDDHDDATTPITPEIAVGPSGGRGRRVSRWLVLMGLSVVVSACATTRAETPRERPALDIPPPPPRVITPLPAPTPLPGPELVSDLPSPGGVTPSTRSRPPQRERENNTAKPEQKPEEAKPVEPPPPAASTPPVPQLRIPENVDNAQLSGQIRDIVERTRKVLEGVDYRTLTRERRKAYDDAKLFATQADEALKTNNLVFAKELADKAERLAKELQGR